MFESFEASFNRTGPDEDATPGLSDARWSSVVGYQEFLLKYAGGTFENGLYRTHGSVSSRLGRDLIAGAFPTFKERAAPFGYDWLGRQFAIDFERRERDGPLVLLLEPGSGQALEIPLTLSQFHDQLHDLREPALASAFFKEWARSREDALPLGRAHAVGYKVPLFLGGADALDNLELTDMDVYWSLSGQLLRGAQGRIGEVRGG